MLRHMARGEGIEPTANALQFSLADERGEHHAWEALLVQVARANRETACAAVNVERVVPGTAHLLSLNAE